MKYHSKSLFLSIIIHLLLLGMFVYVYMISVKTVPASQEKRICVNLKCIKKVEPKSVEQKSVQKVEKKKVVEHKKVEKKPVKKVPKKVVKKELPVKKPKKIPHKSPKKEEPKKVLKPAQEQTHSNVVTKKKEISSQPKVDTVHTQKCTTPTKESLENIYIKNNLDKIATLIHDNLYYPRRARKRGIEGVVVVRFHLQKDGSVKGAKIITSEQEILSRAALKTINELSGEFPKPVEELTLTVPIHYQLD